MIPQLFEALAASTVRPTEFKFEVGAPKDLSGFAMNNEQQLAISRVLEQSKESHCQILQRNDPKRSCEEVMALASFPQGIFNTPNLEAVTLQYFGHGMNKGIPEVTVSDLLHLHPNAWEQRPAKLKQFNMKGIPCTQQELRTFVDLFRDSLVEFEWMHMYLMDGKGAEALDILRGLNHLQRVNLAGLTGTKSEERTPKYSRLVWEAIRGYVAREIDENPLRENGFA